MSEKELMSKHPRKLTHSICRKRHIFLAARDVLGKSVESLDNLPFRQLEIKFEEVWAVSFC